MFSNTQRLQRAFSLVMFAVIVAVIVAIVMVPVTTVMSAMISVLVMIAVGAVVRDIAFTIPIVPHEQHRLAAGAVFAAMSAPIPLVAGTHM